MSDADIVERVVSELAIRKDKLSGHIRRRADIAALVANKWGSVWANELEDYELPMVATDYIHRVGRTIATYGIPVAAGAGGNGGGEARRTCELVITPTSGERRAFSCKV